MDSSSIVLPGAEIERISLEDGILRLDFSRVIIIKTMTGAEEKTKWWQAGSLIIEGAEAQAPLPEAPAICDGGDVDENIYTYRNMIPIPLDSRGHTRCALKLRDSDAQILVQGETIRLEMRDVPKYIEHIRD